MASKKNTSTKMLVLFITLIFQVANSQQVEVQGELKITEMSMDDTQENLVIKNNDGTLGTRSVASLPLPPPPIDTARNLASDFELAKQMCECGTNLPPFLVESLLESGYTEADLLSAGVPLSNISFTCGDDIIDERDGKTYGTIQIGNQCWMTENLNIGTMVTIATTMKDNNILEKYCPEDISSNCAIYGGLYQMDEMMQYNNPTINQGICPTNWHLPTDNEFKILEMQLGMSQAEADNTGLRGTNQGSQLAGNKDLWNDGLLDQDADFGTAGYDVLPAGYISSGVYVSLSESGNIWTKTTSGNAAAWRRTIASQSNIRYNTNCTSK